MCYATALLKYERPAPGSGICFLDRIREIGALKTNNDFVYGKRDVLDENARVRERISVEHAVLQS